MGDKRNPKSGGVAIAFGALAGFLIGARNGQGSLGLITGLVAGCLIALAVFLLDRRA